jgi:hypothetical protein
MLHAQGRGLDRHRHVFITKRVHVILRNLVAFLGSLPMNPISEQALASLGPAGDGARYFEYNVEDAGRPWPCRELPPQIDSTSKVGSACRSSGTPLLRTDIPRIPRIRDAGFHPRLTVLAVPTEGVLVSVQLIDFLHSFILFVGLVSSGNPPRLVPGKLEVRISLSSWLTRRWGYSIFIPSKQFADTLSPVLKKECCSAACAVRRFSGSYSSRAASNL